MKKSYIVLCAVLLAMQVSIAKAEVTPLSVAPSIVTLPHTFTLANPYGCIDINKDGIRDFTVEFDSYRAGIGLDYCSIEGYTTDNRLLVEFESGGPKSPLGEEKTKLGAGGTAYTTMLERGTLIESLPPVGSTWRSFGYFFLPELEFESPLQANSTDGVNSGYVGTSFVVGGNTYYGWLNVTLDPSGTFVTINSAGYASAPSTPIPAGLNDPFAVPVPLIASILGFGLIGGGAFLRRKKKNQ